MTRRIALLCCACWLAAGCGGGSGRPLPPDKLCELRDRMTGGKGFRGASADKLPSLELGASLDLNEFARLANEKDGLHKAMRQFAEKTSQGELVFIGNADNGVTLDQVRELLGKEDGSEQGTGNDSGVTFYGFSWVRVGFSGDKYPFVLRCSAAKFLQAEN